MKIKEILEYGKNNLINEDAYRISKILLKYFLNVNDSYILIHNDEELSENIQKRFKNAIEEIKEGKPLQYVINKQEFMGLNFYVNENVLIPQPDTEILVEEVLNNLKKDEKIKNVLDICTGSGAIGVSIAKYTNDSITMSDISNKALEIAKNNAINNNILDKCKFVLSNMFENIENTYDIIVSNPPYIKTNVIKTLNKDVQNEPNIALDGGDDGLKFYRIIAENAHKHLVSNGILALEIGYDQKEDVIQLLEEEKKYKNIRYKKDLSGNDRVIVCEKI